MQTTCQYTEMNQIAPLYLPVHVSVSFVRFGASKCMSPMNSPFRPHS